MKSPLLFLLLFLMAVITVGEKFFPYGPYVTPPEWTAAAQMHRGIVTRQPVVAGKTLRLVLRDEATATFVQVTLVADSAALGSDSVPVVPGDRIVYYASVAEPRNAGNPGEMDYAAYLRHQGITGTAFCPRGKWQNLGPADHLNLRERALRFRQHLVGLYARHFEGESLALIAAMTLGDRSRIDRGLRELYNRCGASHVIAISGLHLGILIVFLSFCIVRPLRRWGHRGLVVSTALLLLAIWSFAFLAGLPLSLVRAATMCSVALILRTCRRTSSPYHALLLTLFLMLLYNPCQLYDVGLQLSAVAVSAIIWLLELRQDIVGASYPRWMKLQMRWLALQRRIGLERMPRFLRRAARVICVFLVVSAVAQMATMPLVAYYFGRISMVGFLLSLVVIPVAYVLLMGAIAYLLLTPLRGVLAWGLTHLVGLQHGLMAWMTQMPLATLDVTLSLWGVAGCYVVMLLCVMLLTGRRQIRLRQLVGIGMTTFLVLCVETTMTMLQRPTPHIAIYNRPSRTEIHCVASTTDSVVTRRSPHFVGDVLLYAGQKVAVIDHPVATLHASFVQHNPSYTMQAPLEVDALLLARGAKGHLSDFLQRYHPALVVLDGSLTDYYRTRFLYEAAELALPTYDVAVSGACILSQSDHS